MDQESTLVSALESTNVGNDSDLGHSRGLLGWLPGSWVSLAHRERKQTFYHVAKTVTLHK